MILFYPLFCFFFLLSLLKEFIKSSVEPLHKEIETINQEVQQLIQSAPPGVSTSGLDSDLEILGDKWSELNEKVSFIIYFYNSHI